MYSEIIFIATYQEMKEIAEQIIAEKELKIDVVLGELFVGVEKSQEFRRLENDVIISRGGTANLIREDVEIPVVEIEVGVYDLLRSIYKHKDKKIALMGAENVIAGVKEIEETIGLDISYYPFVFDSELEKQISIVCEKGIDIVIGDTVAVRIAKKRGLETELIKSGYKAVKDAIERAVNMCDIIYKERRKSSRLDTILQSLREGILVTDDQNEISFINQQAERILKITKEKAIGKKCHIALAHIEDESTWISDVEISHSVLDIHNFTVSLTKIPIYLDNIKTGTVFNLESVISIQKKEENIRKIQAETGLVAKKTFSNILGQSKGILKTIELAKKYAAIESTILIYGESGTGKEMFAQSIHNVSSRKYGPFTAINCATLPSVLLESILFGYDDGAFTGAKKGGKKGLFELAHNGTLFLDEIGEIDLNIQSKLLRVLQEKEVMRIGGEKVLPVNVRILTATNKNLLDLVGKKLFREDLYYRIDVLNLDIPNLVSRAGDIDLFVEYFMQKYCKLYMKPLFKLDVTSLRILSEYEWPGNIRQLENIIQRLVVVYSENDSQNEHYDSILTDLKKTVSSIQNNKSDYSFNGTLDDITKKAVLKVFEEEGYNKTRTAERLNITRVTLNNKLKKI